MSTRHETCEGQNSTCREAGAILLNLLTEVVVSDHRASLHLSARAMMLVMEASFRGALRPWEFMFVA